MFSASAPVLYLLINSEADFAQRPPHRPEELRHHGGAGLPETGTGACPPRPADTRPSGLEADRLCTRPGIRWSHKLGQLSRKVPGATRYRSARLPGFGDGRMATSTTPRGAPLPSHH